MSTQFIYDMTQTWNAGGTTFTSVKMNVTDTASAAGSLLLDLQVGGSSKMAVNKNGGIQSNMINGVGGDFSIVKFVGNSATGTATNFIIRDGEGVAVRSTGAYAWSSTGEAEGTRDTAIFRNAAGILESNSYGAVGTGGIIPGMRFATTQVVTSLSNSSTAAQNVFAAANDVLTLVASTTYYFDCLYFINTGTTTHTTATGFVASSAFTSIAYLAQLWSTTAGTISTTAPSVLDVTASTATVLNATSVSPRTTIRCNGIIRTNAATTVTPQITFSAGPTGTCEVAVNSYFRIWPVGSNTVAAVGAWA